MRGYLDQRFLVKLVASKILPALKQSKLKHGHCCSLPSHAGGHSTVEHFELSGTAQSLQNFIFFKLFLFSESLIFLIFEIVENSFILKSKSHGAT